MATSVGLRSERGPILLSLMVSSSLVAVDSTILATAVPSVVNDLGGFEQFPWLFSIYLLAQAVSVPIYAKLADTLGRKPIVLFGIALFVLASVLCGLAWSMPALIAFRALQGLGGGAIQPIVMTITGDVYTIAERARIQGYLAITWATSSVIGPTLGGLFSQFLSWRLIFFVNLPLGLLAIWMLARHLHENVVKREHRIDYAGGILLMIGLSALILAVLEGGQAWAWDSPISIGAFAFGGLVMVAFVFVERRAAEPVLPLWVLTRRLLITTTLISVGIGTIVIGLASFIPTYLERSIGAAPLASGLALAALTLGWPLSASQAGRLYLRFGFRTTILVGIGVAVLGTLALVSVAMHPNVVVVGLCVFLIGIGMGLVAGPSVIAAQSSVPWNERGVVTGTNMFARSIGSAIAVAVFGAVANAVYSSAPTGTEDPATTIHASFAVFVAVGVAALLTGIAALAMPRVGRPVLEASLGD